MGFEDLNIIKVEGPVSSFLSIGVSMIGKTLTTTKIGKGTLLKHSIRYPRMIHAKSLNTSTHSLTIHLEEVTKTKHHNNWTLCN